MKSTFKQQLKAQAHALKPIILIGAKGLTPAVIQETEEALTHHELMKIKINGTEKEDRQKIASILCETLKAELVQHIGNTLILYRQRPQ